MKILYISYAQKGAGMWVHTNQFLKAFNALHTNTVAYTPIADKKVKNHSGEQDE